MYRELTKNSAGTKNRPVIGIPGRFAVLDLKELTTNYGAIFMAGSLQPLCPLLLTAATRNQ